MDKEKKKSLNELLVKVRQGDEDSISRLYELMSPTIRYIALKYLKNECEADDLVQDFWYDIKKFANGFLIQKNAYSYLCKVMNRQALNRLKKLNRQDENNKAFVDYANVKNYQTEESLETVDLRNDINNAMLKLTQMQQIIIQETLFEDKTIRQIAKDLGVSKSKVGRLRIEAIEILKNELSKKGWDKNDI
ncbi:MAG: sigma-70 family RNA polymerase sigma factor [Clostridia bacterium]|nr:sigma-70 family RNA polymerase sigma factor [Clostridia bacterium]